MNHFQTGFARLDITPPLGVAIEGYFHRRESDGILDPLMASALAIRDGENLAILFSIDVIGIEQVLASQLRSSIAQRVGTCPEAIFLCCTHTHLGPVLNNFIPFDGDETEYKLWLEKKLGDAACLAVADLKDTEVCTAQGKVPGVSFVRNFRMKDGTLRTNPGWLNPDIEGPICDPDESLSLVIFRRTGGKEIGLINFQVHADCIGGTKFSADYPKFVRDTYEKVIENSHCMFITGALGDTNHVDVTQDETKLRHGYGRARYIGTAIACEAIKIYPMAEKVPGTAVRFIQKKVSFPYNTATAEEIQRAKEVYDLWLAGREEEIYPIQDMMRTTIIAKAWRIVNILQRGSEAELCLSALAFGDVALACIPGEPYGDIGLGIKEASGFHNTLIACCANGYEGYFPMAPAYEGGYESESAYYPVGTAEQLISEYIRLLQALREE